MSALLVQQGLVNSSKMVGCSMHYCGRVLCYCEAQSEWDIIVAGLYTNCKVGSCN